MAEYVVVVEHQDYWRGNEHKWSTVYPYVGTLSGSPTSSLTEVRDLDAAMCYPDPTTPGTILGASLYNVTAKGSPIATVAGRSYLGTDWNHDTSLTAAEPNREVCAVVEWSAGLSSTGKPVKFRKFIHAVPIKCAGVAPGLIDDTSVSNLQATADELIIAMAGVGLAMGNARRFVGSTVTVPVFYGNHQMPRGRRKKRARLTLGNGQSVQLNGPLEYEVIAD